MTWDKPLKTKCPENATPRCSATPTATPRSRTCACAEGCAGEFGQEGLPPEEAEKNRLRREARAAKAAARGGQGCGGSHQRGERSPQEGDASASKDTAAKKTRLPKRQLRKAGAVDDQDHEPLQKAQRRDVQALTKTQQAQYAKALAKYEEEKAAGEGEKVAAKEAANG